MTTVQTKQSYAPSHYTLMLSMSTVALFTYFYYDNELITGPGSL